MMTENQHFFNKSLKISEMMGNLLKTAVKKSQVEN